MRHFEIEEPSPADLSPAGGRTAGGARIVAANLAIFSALYLVGDFALSMAIPPRADESAYRLKNSQFSHALKPNFSTRRAAWGPSQYTVNTNSLGFIGDSFTEGVGIPWEDTFTGQFAADVPAIEVLNAGTASYGPSVYYRKTRWLLDAGYTFDELVVYIDVSDVQDEAVVYREDSEGNILYVGTDIDFLATVERPQWQMPQEAAAHAPSAGVKPWLRSHFAYSNLFYSSMKWRVNPPRPTRLLRSYWTVDPNIPGYGEMGVDGGIRKAMSYMERLKAMLAARGIAMSVAVYPWPDQLEFDRVDSRQVTIWKDWCARNGCARFFDHFPAFFAFQAEHPDWREKLFISGDVHYTRAGNELIARDLRKVYAPGVP